MTLSKDDYKELEDILGPENISTDPSVLEGYSYFRGVGGLEASSTGFYLRPAAVVLPGSTREVQAIIRWANRSGRKLKALSTGYGSHNAVESEEQIMMDLRRMNRILEIDEKNMYAVIEPYVSFAEVQAEAQKRGLNCHIVGAGSQVSALASTTSVAGTTTHGISQGHGSRNLLAMEWVQPSGEILQFGSLGSGAGWFSSNGPGPSLRGVVRGVSGYSGALGVFTKAAMRLNPWPGPAKLEINGASPYYETEVPTTFEYHVLEWPTWEQCADGLYKIGESKIAFALHKTGGPGTHGAVVTGNNNEYYEKRQAGEMLLPRASFAIVLYANTPREHDYGVKVLDRILEETGGKIWTEGEKPTWKKRDYINMVRACFIPRLAYRCAGCFCVDGIVGIDTIDNVALGCKLDDAHRDKYAEKGAILADGTNNNWASIFDGGHFGITECGQPFDPLDEKSRSGAYELVEEGFKISLDTPINICTSPMSGDAATFGPDCSNYHIWVDKVKKTFDPDEVFGTNLFSKAPPKS